MTTVIWVLDVAQVVVLVVVVAGNVAIADGDVAVAFGHSRCRTGGRGQVGGSRVLLEGCWTFV